MESSVRFSSREVGHPALLITDVIFSVNKSIVLNGIALFGGQSADGYKYTITILKASLAPVHAYALYIAFGILDEFVGSLPTNVCQCRQLCVHVHAYQIFFVQGEDVIKTVNGTCSAKDYYGEHDLVNVAFPDPLALEQDQIYTARVNLEGSSYNIGVDGALSITGPGGVTFTLHTGISDQADPNAGPLAKFLYSRSGDSHVILTGCHVFLLQSQ